jgi:hypothetical protein
VLGFAAKEASTMKCVRVAILIAAMALTASAADIAGKWRVYPTNAAPRTVPSISLKFLVSGDRVAGVVQIGKWPGRAVVEDFKIEGDRITFTATGRLDSTTGKPTCAFVATVRDDEMALTMTVVRNAGGPLAADTPYEFSGTKAIEFP